MYQRTTNHLSKGAIFHKFSCSLYDYINRVDPENANTVLEKYVCPICAKSFTKDALKGKNYANPLSLEHVPPQSIGWREKLLTCKNCNEVAGGKFEDNINKNQIKRAFLKAFDGTEVQSDIEIAGHSVKATISYNKTTGIHIHINKDELESDVQLAVENELQKGDFKFNSKIHLKNLSKERVALMRIGYLWAFVKIGYDFIYKDYHEDLRHQLLNPDQRIIDGKKTIIKGDFGNMEGVYLIEKPIDSKCVLVVIKVLVNGFTDKYGVALPYGENAVENHQKFVEGITAKKNNEYSFVEINNIFLGVPVSY